MRELFEYLIIQIVFLLILFKLMYLFINKIKITLIDKHFLYKKKH